MRGLLAHAFQVVGLARENVVLGIGLRLSTAKPKSIVCPGLPAKSMVNRAKTVSTVLMRPKPQLRCMQQPLSASTSAVPRAPFDFPAAAISRILLS